MCRLGALTLAVGLLIASPWDIRAQEDLSPITVPTSVEVTGSVEPLKGGSAFSDLLGSEARILLSPSQRQLLTTAREHYRAVQHTTLFPLLFPDSGSDDPNRVRGDEALLQLLDSLEPSLTLDFSGEETLPDVDEPLPFNPVSQALLIKVVVNDGPGHVRSQILPMQEERYLAPYRVDVAPKGTTWVLLRLREVPLGRSTTGLRLVKDGDTEPFAWHAFTLEPAAPSHLKVDIRDEKDENAPVFLSVRHVGSDRLWPIPDHYDFQRIILDVTGPQEQMLSWLPIHGPDGSLKVSLPGELPQYMWLVQPPVEMTLPAGAWEVTALRGNEFVTHRSVFHVMSSAWQETTITMQRWVNMAERGWISGDDHVHSRMMNSADARTLLALARAMDVRVANILEMGDAHRTYYTQRGFGPEFRAMQHNYWLVPGQEDPRSILGHNIALNTTSLARNLDHYLDLSWVSQQVRRQGGLFGQTHVGQNACWADRGMALMMPHEVYDFVSIMQGGLGTDLYYDFLNLGYKISASAGSDMPYAAVLGDVRVYAHVGEHETFAPDDWFEALRLGRTFTTNGPVMEFTVDGELPGSEIVRTDDAPLTVRARAWGLEGESAPVQLEIVSQGNVVETREAGNAAGGDLSIDLIITPGEGRWIAARATGANGSAAHTTPVYVSRPGLRHWNVDAAASIIDRQLTVLDEIESVIAEVKKREEGGSLNRLDFESVLIARQGAALRAVMESSRTKYVELRVEAERQKERRRDQ